MKFRILFIVAYLLLLGASRSTQAEPCPLKRSQDILTCVISRHPDVREAEVSVQRDRMLKKTAGQRVNPEIETKVVTGDTDAGRILNTETTLFHTMELGGKRRAGLRQAEAQGELTSVSLIQARENAVLQTVLAANRLRQIRVEKSLIGQTQGTFSRILTRFRFRPFLSPEQQVSLRVFETGRQEMTYKMASLIQEEASLKISLEVALGVPFRQFARLLPGPRSRWPMPPRGSIKTEASSSVRQASAELELARANAKIAKSKAWPDVRLGPTVETERQAGDTHVLAGASLQLPLPLFSQNRSGRAYARLEEQRAQIRQASVRLKTAAERENQLIRYRNALKALGSIRTPVGSETDQNIDDLFERGLVPGSLMIEAGRQALELTRMRHEQELAALDALWRMIIIDGKLSEGKL